MRKNFLGKSFTKCGGEIIPRPFFKNSKSKKFYTDYFNYWPC